MVMAQFRCIKASSLFTSSHLLHRRLPLVGVVCMISFGLPNVCPIVASSFSFRTGCAQSITFAPFLRSKFGNILPSKRIHSIQMTESNNGNTVPSIVVYVTVPNKEAGMKLAVSIVREKLAACVNRVPDALNRSLGDQPWKSSNCIDLWVLRQCKSGKIQMDSEELLIIKTREALLEALTEHVKANHEYGVPEVIAMPIIGGSVQYLEWIKTSTRESS